MKLYAKLLFVLLSVLCFLPETVAQSRAIVQTKVQYNKQQVPALMVSLNPERQDLQDAFGDWLKDNYEVKMKGGGLFGDKNIRQADAAQINAITTDNINLFTKTEEVEGATKMYFFASRGLNNFIDPSEKSAFDAMESIFDDFLSFYLPEYYQMRLDQSKEALAELKKDLKNKEKDVKKNNEKIQDLREENRNLESEMAKLKTKIKEAKEKVKIRTSTKKRIDRELKSN